MISKQTFVKIMENVKKLHDYQSRIDGVFDLCDWPIDSYTCNIAEAIAEEMGDCGTDDIDPMILASMYEFEYGTRYGNSYLVKDKNKEYKPTTFEELWDVLMEFCDINCTEKKND